MEMKIELMNANNQTIKAPPTLRAPLLAKYGNAIDFVGAHSPKRTAMRIVKHLEASGISLVKDESQDCYTVTSLHVPSLKVIIEVMASCLANHLNPPAMSSLKSNRFWMQAEVEPFDGDVAVLDKQLAKWTRFAHKAKLL